METTLNVHVEILEQIVTAAKTAGISRSKMIAILIKKAMDDIPDPARLGTLVQYQKRRQTEDQRQVNVQLRIDDYEYFQDLRRLKKMSVSFILAYAVKKFLNKIMINKETDNYRYQNYIVIRETIENITTWRFFWGYPPHIEEFIQLA